MLTHKRRAHTVQTNGITDRMLASGLRALDDMRADDGREWPDEDFVIQIYRAVAERRDTEKYNYTIRGGYVIEENPMREHQDYHRYLTKPGGVRPWNRCPPPILSGSDTHAAWIEVYSREDEDLRERCTSRS